MRGVSLPDDGGTEKRGARHPPWVKRGFCLFKVRYLAMKNCWEELRAEIIEEIKMIYGTVSSRSGEKRDTELK